MKILYIDKKYNYEDMPEGGFSPTYGHFYRTLEKMGEGRNEVIHFPFVEITKKEGKEKMNERLLETVYKKEPDLVFFVINYIDTTALKEEVIREITKRTITLNWFTDDHWQFDKFSKHWAKNFTWIATTDSRAPAKYKKAGFRNVIKTQWGCNHFYYKPLNLPKIYEVVFIGNVYGKRKKNIEEIKKAGINIKCWGKGWSEGLISEEDKIKTYSQSKININFTKSSGSFWKELALIFLRRNYDGSISINNPKTWADNFRTFLPSIWSRQIKGRIFRVTGCGGFLLTEDADNLKDCYEIGKEIVCFNNTKDLIKKIKYYLANDKEREKIAKAGYERALRDHTCEERFNEIFNTIGLIK